MLAPTVADVTTGFKPLIEPEAVSWLFGLWPLEMSCLFCTCLFCADIMEALLEVGLGVAFGVGIFGLLLF